MLENSSTIFDYINYCTEIFEQERFQLSDKALYLHVLLLANRRYWNFPLQISNKLLVAQTGMDEKTFLRARNRLKQKGLIDFEAGVSNKESPKYWLITPRVTPQNSSQVVGKPVSNSGDNSVHIYKDKDKDKEIITPLSPQGEILEKNLKKDDDFSNASLPTHEEKEKIVPPKKEKENTDWQIGLEAEWIALVEKWLDYKRTKKQTYKSNDTIVQFIKRLQQISGNHIAMAKEVVSTSIACNYSGIFPIKNYKNPTNTIIQTSKIIEKF